jgi:hypothetical protein
MPDGSARLASFRYAIFCVMFLLAHPLSAQAQCALSATTTVIVTATF